MPKHAKPYEIKEHNNEGYKIERKKGRHHIMEIGTNQFIADYGSSEEAKSVVRGYKLGKGFNGWTPPFMVGGPTVVQNYNGSAYLDDDIEYVD